jgi:hypothetical protein
MKLKRQKVVKAFNKALTGIKKSAKETSEFVNFYGPKVNRGLGSVATSIQDGFSVPAQKIQIRQRQRQVKDDIYVKVLPSGKKIYVRVPRRMPVQSNPLGMNFGGKR